VGKRLGVEYRLNSAVSSILLSEDKKHATGVRLASGEELHADIVVVNADLVYAYNNLLPPSPEALSLQERPASCSSISFFWSFDCVVPELRPHNIFLADQYEQSFDSIFVEHRIPDEPSFYVNVPSRIDDTAAPPGNDAVVVLVPVGHLVKDRFGEFIRDHEAWDVHISHTRDFVLNVIEARTGVKGLRKKIVSESVETPLSWETKFNLDRGAILGLSHSFFNVLSFRPKTRHSELRGLYFVGASTHPGTGVPICLAGSKITAKQITQDLDRDKSALTNWLGLVLWLVFGGMVAFLGILGGYGVAMGF
jgi:phytoene desaturase (3,4-didehydrolycopene-forming)